MKKVLALTLALVLAFGMATVGFAAAGDRLRSDIDPFVAPIRNTNVDFGNLVVASDATLKAVLAPEGFNFKDTKGNPVTLGASDTMTTSNLSGMTVKTSFKKGGDYFNSPELKYDSTMKTCFIELKTKKGITVTKDMDIDGKIVMSYKSFRYEIMLAGIVSNTEEPVGEDEDAVWVTKGDFVKPEKFIKGLEWNFDSTDDVLAYANVFGGKKYYLWIEEDVQPKDEELIAKYEGIESVYHAYYSSNINVPSTQVQFQLDDKYYVYNQDGKFLGTSDQRLALASTYYLASKKLDIGLEGEELDPDDGAPAPAPIDPNPAPVNPNMGGDGENLPNPTDNPGTGSNGMMNVAVVAGVVALAAAGAVSLKK